MRPVSTGLAAVAFAIFAAATLAPSEALAQFKWREADGSIAYGDRPPDRPVKLLRTPAGWNPSGRSSSAAPAAGALPYDLRVLSQRHPVVLYTTSSCEPCDLARRHLSQRGVPFQEKTVRSRQDVTAFESLGFPAGTGLPVITVGADRQIGYQDVRWNALLDSAGYPKQSRLPAQYVQAGAQPLAAAQPPDIADNTSQARNASEAVPQAPAPLGAAPAADGLRF